MKFLETLEYICGNKFTGDVSSKSKQRLVTDEDVDKFNSLKAIHASYTARLNLTEDYKQYYNWCPLMRLMDDEVQEDVFYTVKLGYYIPNVPSKLVYLLDKCLKKYPPNKAVEVIDKRLLQKYFKKGALPCSIKDIMEYIYGSPISFVQEFKPVVLNKGDYEVLVKSEDKILIPYSDLGKSLISNPGAVETITWKGNQVGLCIGDTPIRGILNRDLPDDYDHRC